MCLICNRSSIAIADEVRAWFEANAVKGAGDIGLALSSTAMMWHHFEIIDHFGGDIKVAVEEGKKALELLETARSRYAENLVIAGRYALDEKIKAKLEEWKGSATDIGFIGPEEEWTRILTILKKDHLRGMFGEMHNQVNELYEDLKVIVAELEQGKFPSDRFGPHMAKWNELFRFGHYASKVYSRLAV